MTGVAVDSPDIEFSLVDDPPLRLQRALRIAPRAGYGAGRRAALLMLVTWAPVIVWAAVIFFMSTDELSAEHTRSWIEPIVRFFVPSLPDPVFEVLHFVVRKLVQPCEQFFRLLVPCQTWDRDSAANSAGTEKNTVGRWRRSVSRIGSGLVGPRINTVVAPNQSGNERPLPSP